MFFSLYLLDPFNLNELLFSPVQLVLKKKQQNNFFKINENGAADILHFFHVFQVRVNRVIEPILWIYISLRIWWTCQVKCDDAHSNSTEAEKNKTKKHKILSLPFVFSLIPFFLVDNDCKSFKWGFPIVFTFGCLSCPFFLDDRHA